MKMKDISTRPETAMGAAALCACALAFMLIAAAAGRFVVFYAAAVPLAAGIMLLLFVTVRMRSDLVRDRLALDSAKRALEEEAKKRAGIERTLSASDDIHRAMIETMPHGIGVLDNRGVITAANHACHRIFGYEEGEMTGTPLYDLMVSKSGRIEIHDFIMALVGGRGELAARTYKCRTRDGRVIDVQIDWSYVIAGGKVTGLIAVFTDVTRRIEAETERTLTEGALRQSEKIAQAILNVSTETIALLDIGGTILDINDIGARRLRRSRDEVVGRHLFDFIPRETFEFGNRQILEVMKTGKPLRYEDRSDGMTFDIYIKPVRDESGKLIHLAFFARDITPLLSLQKRIISISEAERQQLGQDLHDDLGQHLTGISYMVTVLREKLRDRGIEEAEDAAAISSQIKSAIERLRKLSKGLCPVSIEKDGLTDALREMCEEVERIFSIPCAFESSGEARVGDSFKAVNIFHIAQESVNNALKHAKPRRIDLRVASDGGVFTMSVENDIRASDPPPESVRGIGTDIMRYRANLIGGAIDIAQTPKRFIVSLRLDLGAPHTREGENNG